LMLTVMALLIVGAFSTALLTRFHHVRARSTERVRHTISLNLAEAGVEKALAELQRYPAYAGESRTELGDGQFSVEVLPEATPGVYRLMSTAELDEARPTRARVKALVRVNPDGGVQVLEWAEESVR
ncbi:MAG: hypothetical protein IT364_10950, partial [Candidatus Hydrogenedentes bacterium]|nr:hypothetical protein [Candidatus Hydrogenedentota bacterium]